MKSYKYFGNASCEVGLGRNAIVLKKFGQQVMLSDETARDILEAGGGILLAEDFDAVGFTPLQIKDKRERKGEAYVEKHRDALKRMFALRDLMRKEAEVPPPIPIPDEDVYAEFLADKYTSLPLGRAEE